MNVSIWYGAFAMTEIMHAVITILRLMGVRLCASALIGLRTNAPVTSGHNRLTALFRTNRLQCNDNGFSTCITPSAAIIQYTLYRPLAQQNE